MEIDKWYSIWEAEKELRDKATYRLNGKTKAASIFGFDFSFKDNGLWITWPNGIDKTHIEGEEVFKLTEGGEVVRASEDLADRWAYLMSKQAIQFVETSGGFTGDPVDPKLNPGSTCSVDPEIAKHLNDFGKEYYQKPPKKDRFTNRGPLIENTGTSDRDIADNYFYAYIYTEKWKKD